MYCHLRNRKCTFVQWSHPEGHWNRTLHCDEEDRDSTHHRIHHISLYCVEPVIVYLNSNKAVHLNNVDIIYVIPAGLHNLGTRSQKLCLWKTYLEGLGCNRAFSTTRLHQNTKSANF